MSDAVRFDRDAQAVETDRLWAEISAAHDLPEEALLDLRFIAGQGADAVEFMGWLEDAGYDVEHYAADGDDDEAGEDGPQPEIVEVQTKAVPLSLATIHAEERRTTEAALRFGFVPDGWGFMPA